MALAFKVTHDKHMGPLVFMRVYSGVFPTRHALYNATQRHKENPQKFLRVFADSIQEVSSATLGEIFCATGLKTTKTGDTLTVASENYHLELDKIEIPEAVFFVAIEAESSKDETRLSEVLERMLREDPTLTLRVQKETGQTLLGGMGELHLEVVGARLRRDHEIDFRMGEPRVAYREEVVEPVTVIHHYDHTFGENHLTATLRVRIASRKGSLQNKCELSDQLAELDDKKKNAIRLGVKSGLDSSPNMGLPLVGAAVDVLDFGGAKNPSGFSAQSLQACAASAVRHALKDGGTNIVEPVMKLEIVVPERMTAVVTKDLTRRRGIVEAVEMSGPATHRSALVTCIAPLHELVGYSTALRSATQGNAGFSMHFHGYDTPSEKQQEAILREVRGY